METCKMLVLVLSLAGFAAGSLLGAGVKTAPASPTAVQGQPQTKCPVLGGKINRQIYADYNGRRIYFCCEGCVKQFKQNPEKYMKKLQEQGVTLESTPAGATKK